MLGPMPPSDCPWQALAAYGPPNVKWCEERLCAWIGEPANAWSNLAFVLVALAIHARARGLRGPLRRFAPTVALVGATSFVYHASNTAITQLLDFFGMYLFCGLLLALNAARLGWLSARRLLPVLLASTLALTAVTAVLVRRGAPIQAIVLALIAAIVATEAVARRRVGRRYRLGAFAAALALLAAALACSLLDATRVWCDPSDHVLQGHAAWHVLSALSLLAAFVHYRQFADGALAG